MTGGVLGSLLADSHTAVPSEAVSTGLAAWWLFVVLLGLLSVASGSGFVIYLRRTAPERIDTSDTGDMPGEQPGDSNPGDAAVTKEIS